MQFDIQVFIFSIILDWVRAYTRCPISIFQDSTAKKAASLSVPKDTVWNKGTFWAYPVFLVLIENALVSIDLVWMQWKSSNFPMSYNMKG